MAVYVDQLSRRGWRIRGRYVASCHLIADSLDELHAFAEGISLQRQWFQNKPGGTPHYDLTPKKREKAVAVGAVELDRRAFVTKMREIRDG